MQRSGGRGSGAKRPTGKSGVFGLPTSKTTRGTAAAWHPVDGFTRQLALSSPQREQHQCRELHEKVYSRGLSPHTPHSAVARRCATRAATVAAAMFAAKP